MMKLGACVTVLGECHPLGCDHMQQVQTKVERFAKVTSKSDRKTFTFGYNMSLESSRVFLNTAHAPPPLFLQVEGQVDFLADKVCITKHLNVVVQSCPWTSASHSRVFDCVPRNSLEGSEVLRTW